MTSGAYTPKTVMMQTTACGATATYTDNIAGDALPVDDTDNDDDDATPANMDGIDVSKLSERAVQTS